MQDDITYLTVQDVAKRLQTSEQTIRRWILSGALPAIELVGGQYRIHPDDFAEFLRKRRIRPKND